MKVGGAKELPASGKKSTLKDKNEKVALLETKRLIESGEDGSWSR